MACAGAVSTGRAAVICCNGYFILPACAGGLKAALPVSAGQLDGARRRTAQAPAVNGVPRAVAGRGLFLVQQPVAGRGQGGFNGWRGVCADNGFKVAVKQAGVYFTLSEDF